MLLHTVYWLTLIVPVTCFRLPCEYLMTSQDNKMVVCKQVRSLSEVSAYVFLQNLENQDCHYARSKQQFHIFGGVRINYY